MSGLQTAHSSIVGDAFKAGIQNFVDQSSLITVPYTSIVGRAQIPDIANDLRASLGVDRIVIQQLIPLPTETGANGEPVYALVNDDRNLIRAVGYAWPAYTLAGQHGLQVATATVGDYLEITFYGTGLNVLSVPYSDSRAIVANVDGGSDTANLYTVVSAILTGRNYATYQVVTVASSLTLGIHTVKIRLTVGSAIFYGFEVLNQNASGLININPGTAYIQGQKVTTAVSSVAYNTGVTGTRGGRSIRYLNSDGTFSQAFQAVDLAAAYLTNASHTNEEVARVYHHREFGAARNTMSGTPDDFSTVLAGTDRAFTLDDGSTTLVTIAATTFNEGFFSGSGTGSITITFIGTGLDIQTATMSTTTAPFSLLIDGNTIATNQTGYTQTRTYKIVSGLPYGTHTVKFLNTSTGTYLVIKNFLIYQPKKPSVPSTAVEISDYNVMASYVANTTQGTDTIGTGVLRKVNTREISCVEGTGVNTVWSGPGVYPAYGSGAEVWTSRINAIVFYSFFGTGVDIRYKTNATHSANISVKINGLLATVANFPTLAFSAYGGSFASGILSQAVAGGLQGGLSLSNLPLGIYTVSLTNNQDAGAVTIGGFDVITPIHTHKSNFVSFQNTLPVGSNSLLDSRPTTSLKGSSTQKAWAQALGIVSSPTIANVGMNVFAPCPEMSVTVKTQGGPVAIYYSLAWNNSSTSGSGTSMGTIIYINGTQVPESIRYNTYHAAFANYNVHNVQMVIVPLPAGWHNISLQWSTNGANQGAYAAQRLLSVREL